jgi:phage tail sheath protein FI
VSGGGFFHGVQVVERAAGARPITGVRSAVVGLVGTAPVWQLASGAAALNRPTLVTNLDEGVRLFGSHVEGYTIPAALRAIFDQGAGAVLVVNVFDPFGAGNRSAVASYNALVRSDLVVNLGHKGVANVVVKDEDDSATFIQGVHYTVDAAAGQLKFTDTLGSAAAGSLVRPSYTIPDPSGVTPAQVSGAQTVTGTREGLLALEDSVALYGFGPKVLIAPGYCTDSGVAAALRVTAERLRALALVDVPVAVSPDAVLLNRGGVGTNYSGSSEHVVVCYPHVKVADPVTGEVVLEPFSPRLAGAIAAGDLERGHWASVSNRELRGVVGMERPLTARLNDPNSEANRLNGAGVVTLFAGYGTGVRVWGNRSQAFPASSAPTTFIPFRRTVDLVHDALEAAMLQFMDAPLTPAYVDAIVASVNEYIRGEVGRGALLAGAAWFDPAMNPAAALASGVLRLELELSPPAPLESVRIYSKASTSGYEGFGSENR